MPRDGDATAVDRIDAVVEQIMRLLDEIREQAKVLREETGDEVGGV